MTILTPLLLKSNLIIPIAQLKAYFESFGPVREVKVMRNKRTKMPKGYGFVIFKNDKIFHRIKNMNHILNGRTLDINVGCKKENAPNIVSGRQRKIVYVGGVAQSVTESEFKLLKLPF